MSIKFIDGGVCAPKGYKAAGVHCGIRKNRTKRDLALIMSEVPAAAAGVYTKNAVKGAPVYVTKENLSDGVAQAVIVNSGNANTCAAGGIELAKEMCALTAESLNIKAEDVIVASTGVIGQKMSIEPIKLGIPLLLNELSADDIDAAEAIMTTDTQMKRFAVEFTLGGKTCRIGAIGKGSGMIHPNMATMLVFVTTDAAISSEMLQKAIRADVDSSFNMLSIDGDTSTNDTLTVMANGLCGNAEIISEGEDYSVFTEALGMLTRAMARALAADGEGASKLLVCTVNGAADIETARAAAKSVICSDLLKAAMFGADANWGRVICAVGYCGKEIAVEKIDIAFSSAVGAIAVCKAGEGVDFSEELAKSILSENEIDILIELNDGAFSATAWGCDLTYDYVKINGDYRS